MHTPASEEVLRLMAALTPREKKVLCERLGISEDDLMQGNFDLQKLSVPVEEIRARLRALEERISRFGEKGPKGGK